MCVCWARFRGFSFQDTTFEQNETTFLRDVVFPASNISRLFMQPVGVDQFFKM